MPGSYIQRPGVPRPIRAVLAFGVLLLIVWFVVGALLSYQRASSDGTARETTQTTAPSDQATSTEEGAEGTQREEPAPQGVAVLVLIDGLNLREQPSTGARVIKRLQAGQRLLLLEEGEGWYHVRDVDGADGWVAAGGSYTRLEK